MNLQNIRDQLSAALIQSGQTQIQFATKHGLSYSWINKFLNGQADNPEFASLERLRAAIEAEEPPKKLAKGRR